MTVFYVRKSRRHLDQSFGTCIRVSMDDLGTPSVNVNVAAASIAVVSILLTDQELEVVAFTIVHSIFLLVGLA